MAAELRTRYGAVFYGITFSRKWYDALKPDTPGEVKYYDGIDTFAYTGDFKVAAGRRLNDVVAGHQQEVVVDQKWGTANWHARYWSPIQLPGTDNITPIGIDVLLSVVRSDRTGVAVSQVNETGTLTLSISQIEDVKVGLRKFLDSIAVQSRTRGNHPNDTPYIVNAISPWLSVE